MKINRSTKCSLKFVNQRKQETLALVLTEYGRVVNLFIGQFWIDCPHKNGLLKPVVDSVDSWFSARLRKVAAREAIDMILASKRHDGDKARKPVHKCKRMCLSSTIAELLPAKHAKSFDCWLHLQSVGNKINLQIPVKLHKHYKSLAGRGKRLASYVITIESVQFSFEIETGPKLAPDACRGIDTGIKALASASDGRQYGRDIEAAIERIKRCKHGSKGQLTASRALRQRMAEVAKEVTTGASLVVVEKLTGLAQGTKVKRRLGKKARYTIGRWNLRYWLERLQMTCEDRNVSFRQVRAAYTSQTCPSCGHVDRGNRSGEKFRCQKCGLSGNADITAARNILDRFLSGPYGAGCKPLPVGLNVN